MTNNEVNKVISEYMGYKFEDYSVGVIREEYEAVIGTATRSITPFTFSLDSLVPVWKRLNTRMGYFNYGLTDRSEIGFQIRPDLLSSGIGAQGNTIQEAAAHATAKAILAIGEKK